jgi:UDP-sulfoquinovose synthase
MNHVPEWKKTDNGYLLEGMRVLILGMDGYLGWPLALKLAKLGCKVYGIDNMLRRKLVAERGAQSVTPIQSMEDRIKAAKQHLGVEIDFPRNRPDGSQALFAYIKEVQPESIVQFAEIPSAPYSMADVEKAVNTIQNNVVGHWDCCSASVIMLRMRPSSNLEPWANMAVR